MLFLRYSNIVKLPWTKEHVVLKELEVTSYPKAKLKRGKIPDKTAI